MTAQWPFRTMKIREVESNVAHDNVRRSLVSLLVLSALFQLLYLVALPISIEADGAGYYLYARGIAGLDHAWFKWWRSPGFPLYLHLLGMTWLDTFNGVLAANALLGILMPALLYGTLLPVGERYAFGAALVFTASTIPFSYAKVLTTDHPYSFFLLLTAFFFSRFVVTQRWHYAILTTGAVLMALMIRHEALYLAVVAVALLLSMALWQRNKIAIISICLSALIAISLIFAWSLARSRVLKQPELFGSLHNFTGRQLFWRVYVSLGTSNEALSFSFSRPSPSEAERWAPDKTRIIFVQAKNGPASAELAEMFPGALRNPTEELVWRIIFGTEMMHRKGIQEGDAFLLRVVKETIVAHPEILAVILASGTPYLGIHLPGSSFRNPPIFSWWTFDTYEAMPYNIDNTVVPHLTPRLLRAYAHSQWQIEDASLALTRPSWDQRDRPNWLNTLHRLGQMMHNIVRNTLGVVLVLTVWFLPVSRHRALATFLFLSCVLQLALNRPGNPGGYLV